MKTREIEKNILKLFDDTYICFLSDIITDNVSIYEDSTKYRDVK